MHAWSIRSATNEGSELPTYQLAIIILYVLTARIFQLFRMMWGSLNALTFNI